jgi:hypothetical protein
VKTVDPKYPDRQWVQRTARKRLATATKTSMRKLVITKTNWIRLGIVGFMILSIAVAVTLFLTRKTVNDEFYNPFYNDTYNKSTWTIDTSDSRNFASQQNGTLTLVSHGYGNYIDLMPKKYTYKVLTSPTFIKSYFMLQPQQNGGTGIFVRIKGTGSFVGCSIWGEERKQFLECQAINFDTSVQEINSIAIDPGSWHTAYIEVDPNGPEFTFYLDGKNAGLYLPSQTDRYESAEYSLFISSTCSGNGCTDQSASSVVEGVFDYVEIGPVP